MLDKVYYNNRAEGIHLGLGLKTNNKFSDFVSAGGYFGYGLNDQLWKFGGDLDFTLSSEKETHFILELSEFCYGARDFRSLS